MLRPIPVLLLLVVATSAHAAATLRQAFDAAWARAVPAQTAPAREALADADRALADSLLAGAPSVTLARRDDRHGRGLGFREEEFELALPVWRPGERGARQSAAARAGEELSATLAAARLALAGEVREAAHVLAAAQAERERTDERLTLADALQADVARREAAGELARTDLLLATEETLAARGARAEAQAREASALARWRLLTGLDALPAQLDERSDAAGVEHPRLAAAASAVASARAAMEAVRHAGSEAPELALGWQRTRENHTVADNQTLRLALRVPLDGPTRRAPQVAAANVERIRAEAEAARVAAEIESERLAAEAQLDQAQVLAALSAQREAAAGERAKLIEKAFRLGERGLAEWLHARSAHLDAVRDAGRAALALRAARSQLLQARGVLP